MKGRVKAALAAGAGVFAITAFSAWGFDPASWGSDGRLFFALFLIWASGSAYVLAAVNDQ